MRAYVKNVVQKTVVYTALLIFLLSSFVQPALVVAETLATPPTGEVTEESVPNDLESLPSSNLLPTTEGEAIPDLGEEMPVPSEESTTEELNSNTETPPEDGSTTVLGSTPEIETPLKKETRIGGQDQTGLIKDLNVNFAVRQGSTWYPIIENNQSVVGHPEIFVGNEIRISFNWNILEDAMAQLVLGDYFSFKLPQSHIKFNNTDEISFKDQNDTKIGVYQIIDGTVRVKLNEVGLSFGKITSAYVSITGSIVSAGSVEDWEVTEGLMLPPITVPPGQDKDDTENGHVTPIVKYGAQTLNKNELAWTMYVNQDNEARRFRGEEVKKYYNAYFVDKLSDGQVFSSVRIETVLMVALSNGAMSNRALFWYSLDNIPPQVPYESEATIEEFKEKLAKNGSLSYGVFDNTTFIIYLGDIPNNEVKLPKPVTNNDYWFLKDQLQRQLNSGHITQERYNITLDYYKDNPEIVSFGITVFTKLDGEDKNIKNTAHLVAETREATSNEATVNYQNIEGGATTVAAKAVKIKKTDDANHQLKDIVFKLERKDDSGEYQPYQPVDGDAQRATDANGEVLFEKLKSGDYRVVEVTKLPNYGEAILSNNGEFTIADSDQTGITVKVVNPALTDIQVAKKWDDHNNQDGKRPSSVQVQLYANEKKSGPEITLNEGNGWAHRWEGLAKNAENKAISYTVKEVQQAPGYEATYGTNGAGQLEITNTYQPETTEVAGTKTWDDAENQDGQRPANIKINLLAEGKVVDSREVSEATGWAYSFTDLPKFVNGEAIVYSITEDTVPGYTPTITGNNVTNHHTPGKTSATVTKAWDDQNNQDGKRPNTIQVQLYADGEKSGSEVSLNAGNDWSYTWTDLAEKAKGQPIVYTVKEVDVPDGYTSQITSGNPGNLVITNTYQPEKTEVAGTKTWDDAENQDGQRPETITINLLADGKVVDSRKVSEATSWAYSFTNLPKFAGGEVIVYTITEDTVPGYTPTIAGNNVTNRHTPGKTSATVTKAWDDQNNQDGKRPNAIQVQLYADDKKSGPEVSLNVGNDWGHTWTDLAEKAKGQTIVYTVKEVDVPDGYTSQITSGNPGNLVITNTYQPETTEVAGTKTWDDAENQDGERPANIKINLLADGKVVDTREVSEATAWAYSFTHLPKYANGEAIVYTMTEDTVPGYTPTITGNNVTNRHTPGKTSATVTKAWNDVNNQDGKRPNTIQVQLYADGEKSGTEVSLNAGNDWSYTWTDLAEKAKGQTIVYTVKEVDVPDGYTSQITSGNPGNLVITNTYQPETTEVAGTKTWDDAENQDGQRPETITINLLADGKVVDSRKVSEATSWAYSFTNLPKFAGGEVIVYTITEDTVPGYTPTITGNNVTNRHTPGKTSATVTKAWDDQNNQDGKRPTSINVQLYADGEKSGKEISLTTGNKWTYTWTDLAEKAKGQTIVYTVKEVDVPDGYTATIKADDQGNITITNTHQAEVTNVLGTKTWDDQNDQAGQRPASVTINLLADGVKVESKVITKAAEWRYRFTNLPKFNKGQKIVYTVTENTVTGYSTVIKGHDITNTYTPDKTSATVTKMWQDQQNQAGLRPTSIKVQLYADGKKSGPAVTLTAKTKWTYSWSELAEKADGKPIVYTVKEVDVPKGYDVTYKQDNRGNFIVTNSHTPVPKGKKPPKGSGKNVLPKTGEDVNHSLLSLGATIALGAVWIFYSTRKQEKNKLAKD